MMKTKTVNDNKKEQQEQGHVSNKAINRSADSVGEVGDMVPEQEEQDTGLIATLICLGNN